MLPSSSVHLRYAGYGKLRVETGIGSVLIDTAWRGRVRRPSNMLRELPPIHRLIDAPDGVALCAVFGRQSVLAALRAVLGAFRADIAADLQREPPSQADIFERAALHLKRQDMRALRPVINATGIVLHTNLGRAPLAHEAIEAMARVATRYCNLEFDLHSGRRGARTQGIEPLARALTGAEAALAVNNGAAAVLLALSALADGGEVIVSRGELVEIGGGFRIPDVIRQGGARLVEVGCTNKTRLQDYRDAIGPETRVLLKVHQSNFCMVGFTEEVGVASLAALAQSHDLRVVADVGSGLLHPAQGVPEPTLRQALADGADLVTCSGDKLLGGPQAGLVLGREAAVDLLRRHPLLRAVRLDKMTLAALEATLVLHREAPEKIPVLAMLAQSKDQLRGKAERLLSLIGFGAIEPSEAFVGGGALPEQVVQSWAVVLEPPKGIDAAAAALREAADPVVARIARERLMFDVLTVAEDELRALAAAVRAVLA